MNDKRARIGITLGDPGGSAIAAKAISAMSAETRAQTLVVRSLGTFAQACRLIGSDGSRAQPDSERRQLCRPPRQGSALILPAVDRDAIDPQRSQAGWSKGKWRAQP
jgi:hypothetical protein